MCPRTICASTPIFLDGSQMYVTLHCAFVMQLISQLVIPFTEIRTIEKKMTALVIPNAIGVQTRDAKVRTYIESRF